MGKTLFDTRKKVYGSVFKPIPRIIHQTWKCNVVPEGWRPFQESWRKHHPGWEYRLWTDDDIRELIAKKHPWFLATFDGFPRAIQRVDAAKYFILYTVGGVYADLDAECLQPVDELVDVGGVVVGRSADRVIECAFLTSSPGHGLWPVVFSAMQHPAFMARALHHAPPFVARAGFDAAHVLFHTGPQMFGQALRRHSRVIAERGGDAITVLDSAYLSSRSWWRRFEPHGAEGGYIRHHYANSWLEEDEARFVRRFTRRDVRIGSVIALFGLLVVIVASMRL